MDPFTPPGLLDLAPKRGRLTTELYHFPLQTLSLPDLDRDFDGIAYRGPAAGAYAGEEMIRRLRIEIKR